MTTTVSSTSTSYTWATATFAWNSYTAGIRDWVDANIYHYTIETLESLPIAESERKAIAANIYRDLNFTELLQKPVSKFFSEAFTAQDAFVKTTNFYRNILETLNVAEHNVKDLAVAKGEYLRLSDSERKTYNQNISENLAVADALGRLLTFVRGFSENLSVQEAYNKAIELNFADALKVFDTHIRRANAVYSELKIATGKSITDAEFESMMRYGGPAGWENFKTFVGGDYNIDEAIVRYVLESTTSDKGRLSKLTSIVDVPDVFDKGTSSITVANPTVNFVRKFTVPPEVVVSLSGGTIVAVPKITSITTTGFTVVLEDSTGTQVDGNIIWSAHGY